ncbi:Butenolide signaling repressing protein-like [Trema orientale]|uniref:Butenolide signaling repressing protein-like n=1 Tax=Trema orientale TaxID=63057 RepID=A0A2P5EMA1_TREOI|nr:Butenolide signaling repressing protein-like [Trema orientale]
MPTPVSVARQCLTPEAAHALDEAVAVARRRGHAQTTSLHAVSALLSLPSSSSPLRDACARARNSAYSPRLQFKALELCLSVSLDRVSSTQLADDPPVSNSLMAAIKRSQANQRRQPENYHLYHQIPQQSSSIACVKVELQHLTLSILDDPVVSRVFGEAGFRSSEIKLAILRPFSQLLRYSRYRGPPVFLCNLTEYPPHPGHRSSGLSFPGFAGFFSDGDGNCRRIGEVLGRNHGRNPLLVGVCAYDALRSFVEALEKRKDGVLPVGLSGLTVICIENEVSRTIMEDSDEGSLNLKLKEVTQLIEECSGPGLVVNFGDLKAFVDENSTVDVAVVSNVVDQITRLMELHSGKVWLIGATASYESYLKFVSRFPSIEKDWDLQLLPITSLRSSTMAESYPRSSLMESFVPFGGFFSAPSDVKFPLSSSFQCPSRSLQCSDNSEHDVSDVSKGGLTSSVAEQCQSSLPSWLQMAALNAKGPDVKTKDGGDLLNVRVPGLQKNGDNAFQHLRHARQLPEANFFPTIVGFRSAEKKRDCAANLSSFTVDVSADGTKHMDLNSCVLTDVEKISASQASIPRPVVSKEKTESFSSGLWEKPSKDEDLESGGPRSPPCSMSNSSMGDGNETSPASVTSVTTDLGLGICFSSGSNKLKKHENQNPIELQQDISGCFSENVDLANVYPFNHTAQSSSSSSLDNRRQFDPIDVKMLFRALFERVGLQWEAISVICQTIVRCRTREKCQGASQRGDIWLNFVGPDRSSKKKIASSLAEVLYGSRENVICVDLSTEDEMIRSEMNGYDVKFRGKTIVDCIAGEMYKKPLAVIFLENVHKSDVLVRNSLSQAISTGKFSDSYGREVSTNNKIFLTTSAFSKDHNIQVSKKESSNYSEEKISKTKGRPLRIVIEGATRDSGVSQSGIVSVGISNPVLVNKRKLIGVSEPLEQHDSSEMAKRAHKTSSGHLDLNLPAEEIELQQETNEGGSENDTVSENSEAWLQDFIDQVGETVVFKPVDFDSLAEKIFKDIKNSFHKSVHSKCSLVIESKVMEQLLAAVYLSDGYKVVQDWVDQVLSGGFSEIQKRHNSLAIHSVVKLVTYEGLNLEEQPQTVYLPPRIIIN